MLRRRVIPLAALLCLFSVAAATPGSAAADDAPASRRLGYNRDIRPILSENCFGCHGPDEHDRKGGLRLDAPQPDTPPTDSGTAAIVPGTPGESELIARILSDDPDVMMPPPSSNKTLSAVQKKKLEQWIAAGAAYEPHWAYLAPVRPDLPPVRDTSWPKNSIDRFVLARVEKEGLAPSPEADRSTLIRRLSLDLIGLPPSRAEAEAFLADTSPDAYEKLVDRLLASPHYGERMAVDWLDTDQASAALVSDLRERGLLDDTLVVWGGEFGRTVFSQGTLTAADYGRDHHPRCFTMWMARAGVKAGTVYGETDDYSYNVVKDPVHIHDLNATTLHLLGIDHTKLTYRFAGRDYRLTDVHGNVVQGVLA